MTRAHSDVQRVLELRSDGCSVAEIVKRTSIPRGTVRTWLAGKRPAASPTTFDPAMLPRPAYSYLLGLYLGDGCISAHPKGVYRLRLFLDAKYPEILEEAESALSAVMPASKVGRLGKRSRFTDDPALTTIEVSSYSKRWPLLFPQHGPGRKHERPIELTGWQIELCKREPELLLRGLIHSDGCRFINTGTKWSNPRYSFSNRSEDIHCIFCWGCDVLGLRYTYAPHTTYVSRRDDVARMDEFIGPKA